MSDPGAQIEHQAKIKALKVAGIPEKPPRESITQRIPKGVIILNGLRHERCK